MKQALPDLPTSITLSLERGGLSASLQKPYRVGSFENGDARRAIHRSRCNNTQSCRPTCKNFDLIESEDASVSMSWLTVVAHNRFTAPARLDRSILRESFVKALGSFWGNRRYSVSIAAIDPRRVVSAFGVRGILRHLPASAGRQAVALGRCLYSAASHAPAIDAPRGSCCMSSKRRRDGCAGEVRGRSLCTAVARPRFLQHTRSGAFVSPTRLSAAPSNLTCSRANPCLPCIRSSKSPSCRVPDDRRSASGAARRRPGLA